MFCKAWQKCTDVPHDSKELSYMFCGSWCWPIHNAFHLGGVFLDASGGDVVPEKINFCSE